MDEVEAGVDEVEVGVDKVEEMERAKKEWEEDVELLAQFETHFNSSRCDLLLLQLETRTEFRILSCTVRDPFLLVFHPTLHIEHENGR